MPTRRTANAAIQKCKIVVRKYKISLTFVGDWKKINLTTLLEQRHWKLKKNWWWKWAKLYKISDKCIAIREYVVCIVSSSLTFCENFDRLVRTAKREIRKMIGETIYEMPFIHFSFLSFCQHFFAFSSIWR